MKLEERYRMTVGAFRALTGAVGPSGRCCERVDEHGSPWCCTQILNGSLLTFTAVEIELIAGKPSEIDALLSWEKPDAEGFYELATFRGYLDYSPELQAEIRQWLVDGWLANSLECASHPTRPILDGEHVAGVALVPDCNTPVAMDWYRDMLPALSWLWEEAVDLIGVKPYYPQAGSPELERLIAL